SAFGALGRGGGGCAVDGRGFVLPGSPISIGDAGGPLQGACHVRMARVRDRRRSDQLFEPPKRFDAPDGYLCGSHPEWCQTRRPAGHSVDQVRAGYQPKDREGAGPRNPADAARARRRGDRMKRRAFITLLGGAAAGWPLVARAQQVGKVPHIGIIDDSLKWNAFRHGLRDLGYLEGQNIAFDYAYGDGAPERLAEAAAALVRRPVDVIATFGTPASFPAKQATTTVPIVMISIGDPVRAGLVPSLARPGGNITGNTILGPDVGAKRLQILKEVIPTVSRVAFLFNPDNASNVLQFEELQRAAPTLGVTVIPVSVSPRIEFETAFAAMMKERPDAFAVTGEPFHQIRIAWIIDFMAKNRLPAVYQLSENVR